jgi:hypothetical protein
MNPVAPVTKYAMSFLLEITVPGCADRMCAVLEIAACAGLHSPGGAFVDYTGGFLALPRGSGCIAVTADADAHPPCRLV